MVGFQVLVLVLALAAFLARTLHCELLFLHGFDCLGYEAYCHEAVYMSISIYVLLCTVTSSVMYCFLYCPWWYLLSAHFYLALRMRRDGG